MKFFNYILAIWIFFISTLFGYGIRKQEESKTTPSMKIECNESMRGLSEPYGLLVDHPSQKLKDFCNADSNCLTLIDSASIKNEKKAK